MADLWCQDIVWIGKNDKEVLDTIFYQNWLIVHTLSMNKGKYGNLGCTFGWFVALRGALKTTDG